MAGAATLSTMRVPAQIFDFLLRHDAQELAQEERIEGALPYQELIGLRRSPDQLR